MEGTTFLAVLGTRGRVTGREHARTLKAVMYGGRLYFTRHRPDSDWYKNAAAGPDVWVEAGGRRVAGRARAVDDEGLCRRISGLKYPGQARAAERRVAIEVTLCGPLS